MKTCSMNNQQHTKKLVFFFHLFAAACLVPIIVNLCLEIGAAAHGLQFALWPQLTAAAIISSLIVLRAAWGYWKTIREPVQVRNLSA